MADQKQTYVVPSIGTKGKFTFKQPFDNEQYNGKEYQVSAIRELKELQDSGEKPYESIYQIMSISQSDFEDDITNNVPILVLTDQAGKYLYVPADLVQGMPETTGTKYQEIILAASLGLVPYVHDLSLVKNEVIEAIKNTYGVTTTIEEVRGSAIRYVSSEEDKKYQRLLNNNKSTKFTYKAQFKELEKAHSLLQGQYKKLEDLVIRLIKAGKVEATEIY